MVEDEQGVFQVPAGERELRLYENLDVLLTELNPAHRERLWHVVWRLTGSDPASFSAARRWLKAHPPETL